MLPVLFELDEAARKAALERRAELLALTRKEADETRAEAAARIQAAADQARDHPALGADRVLPGSGDRLRDDGPFAGQPLQEVGRLDGPGALLCTGGPGRVREFFTGVGQRRDA